MICSLIQVGFLVAIMITFHFMEYFISKKHHPDTTTSDSFLVTIPFLFAFSFGIGEFFIESYLFGDSKTDFHNWVLWAGAFITIFGLGIRILAELTAKQAFTHYIATEKDPRHKLVTSGIYHFIRHPGYFGMFVFAIGTQIYLRNPISTVVFTSVLWKFFYDRIQEEEQSLVSMFGSAYVDYRAKTGTWIPLID
ncbi:hypothetical protein M9Y10_038932 [Tritrichomonas musculus]|uniref:Protein-S-isoprenylcysteine O-methyltransferase n=1 Tax=Tritrichomonas musculus TaxID=1915356 RepID=A0ABR2K9T1_9EUKA